MNMIRLEIDGQKTTAQPGSTILQAARELNIDIPTLCYLDGLEPFTSCMVCVVHEHNSDKLLPACSMPVTEGMRISTYNERVQKARKDTLDLLLSEHVGSCEAPCLRACAAYMNIPLMIHHIEKQDFKSAIRVVKQNIALPAVLGRICPAPCEKVCNRKHLDEPISICLLKRFVADRDLEEEHSYQPDMATLSGKKAAIVGAGPAGLAAAYYLRQQGHESDLFDDHELPGGMLRYGITDEQLDKQILDAEIETILLSGIHFRDKRMLGKHFSIAELQDDYDAVILTIGETGSRPAYLAELTFGSKGLEVNRRTFETSQPGVFAGGNSVSFGKLAIRSLGHGKFIAVSVDQFLRDAPVTGYRRRFNSKTGPVSQNEAEQLAQMASAIPRQEEQDPGSGLSLPAAVSEASRCFRCDCRKAVSCKLRIYSTEYEASQQRFKTGIRNELKLLTDHDLIIYEPGKCIKCGLCVQITANAKESLGLTFIDRGYETRIEVPFNELLKKGLQKTALECVKACPTAALALKDTFEEVEDVTR